MIFDLDTLFPEGLSDETVCAPWFVYRESNLEHIRMCQRALEGLPLAVEFRHRSSFDEKLRQAVFEFERRHELVHVVTDEPQDFPSSIPTLRQVTDSTAVVRLHGRNAETRDAKGLPSSAGRFKYLYSDEELTDLAGQLRGLASGCRPVHVLFNNNYTNDAQRNARRLGEILAV